MKYIKKFNESKESIDSICKKYKISNYTINGDGSIDVTGNVFLSHTGISKLPLIFNKVTGIFGCSNNQLTSLEGGPKIVGGGFNCSNNQLVSLEGGPKYVGVNSRSWVNFSCQYNYLRSVRGFPEDFEGLFYVGGNPVFEIFNNLPYNGENQIRNAKIAHLLNEYDVISLDGKKIYRDSIEEMFNVLGLEMPKNLKFNNYEIH